MDMNAERKSQEGLFNKQQGLLTVTSDAAVNTLSLNEEEAMLLTSSGAKCLTFDETFDNLVASSSRIFVTMPAKAAGSSLKQFTNECVGLFGGHPDSNAPVNDSNMLQEALTKNYKVPKLITSHLYTPSTFVRMVENAPHNSLIIYMHRDETDRFISAIKMVVLSRLCREDVHIGPEMDVQIDGSRCVFSEKDLIDKVIKPRIQEIQLGAPDIMSCSFYDAIEKNLPQMVFINYKQADKLQDVLAKYHCPELLDGEEIHANVAEDKQVEAFMKLESNGEEVPMLDWLEEKGSMLEYTYDLRKKQTCRSKTLNMQDDLLFCKDEVLEVTRDTSF